MAVFRPLARKHKQISKEECVEILTKETRGVLSVNGDHGYPYATPMNHFYNADDGCLYFHCGKSGHRLDSLKHSDKVSFCVLEQGIRRAGEWAFDVRSVIVFGRVEFVDDMSRIIQITTALCRKFPCDEEYIKQEVDTYGKATLLFKLIPEHICGKRVTEA